MGCFMAYFETKLGLAAFGAGILRIGVETDKNPCILGPNVLGRKGFALGLLSSWKVWLRGPEAAEACNLNHRLTRFDGNNFRFAAAHVWPQA